MKWIFEKSCGGPYEVKEDMVVSMGGNDVLVSKGSVVMRDNSGVVRGVIGAWREIQVDQEGE